jgi:hypothetical protein
MWQRDWGRLVVLALFPTGAMFVMALLGGIGAVATGMTGSESPGTAMMAALVGLATIAIVFLAILYTAATAGMFAVVDEAERTGAGGLSVWQSFLLGLSKTGKLLAVVIITGALCTVAFSAFFGPLAAAAITSTSVFALGAIPGFALFVACLYGMLRLAPLWVVTVVEDVSIVGAFARAFALTRGRVGTIFVAFLLYFVVMMAVSMGGSILGLIPIIGILINLVVSLGTMTLGAAWQFSLYAGLVSEDQRTPH